LTEGDLQALEELAGREKGVVDILLQFLYDPQDIKQWRALEGLGLMAGAHPEQVRKVITRLLWLLNEDSGSFGWGAAAALGEIGRHQISLVQDLLPMFGGLLWEEFSREPMLWGIGRLAEVHPQALEELVPEVMACLQDPDPQVRGLSAWCLGYLGARQALGAIQDLLVDAAAVTIYDRGELRQTTVGELAREALARLG